MSLAPGTRLGPYEITAKICAGGMGEVYPAHDSRIGRDVAIKVAVEQFGERFEREARAVAALNHPNVCTLHDVGPNYLVMELVEGEAPKGPLPLQTALDYARQIADALDAAHEKGIVHRDLKPDNMQTGRQARRHLGIRRRLLRDADRPTRVRGRLLVDVSDHLVERGLRRLGPRY